MQTTIKETMNAITRNNRIIGNPDKKTDNIYFGEHKVWAYHQNKRLGSWLKDFLSGKTWIGKYE